ncbi:MAG TPA: XRE family transcriptional regulator [Candidatus Competibacter sp.]|nr:XRE family transcriptional regulator [Candidatus Competibacter sp.]
MRVPETPDWLEALRDACAESSQAAVARRLGVSPAMVNQAIKGLYKGDLDRLQGLVEGVLLRQFVDCPAAEDMPKHRCLEHQARPRQSAFVNPLFAKLYRACRSGCPHSKLPKEY